ncbi:hypothetical protein Tco_0726821 [Tanacetum coccineum]|uniref:Uncharacterized protein n=1 Tax=Tanacetum coccineum TaxID=301880 RepID=A0ABQ4YHL0_9ASTR
MDEELAMRLQEEEKVELEKMQRERAAQEKASNATLTAEFDDVQARMDADALFTYNQLKNKSLEEIQKLYEREQKWINDFVPMDSEMVKESGKKDDDSQKQAKSSKKRPRAEHDEERDDIAINVESLATKYPIIFSEMLDDFDRQDVVDLYRLVKESEKDEIWKGQQDYKLISWRLFDSCGFHVLLMDTGIAIHMMVEKKYPLIQEMLSRMLNRRLEVDHESTMTFELIRFIKAQLEEGGLLGIRGFYNLMLLVQVCAAAED